jgi:hypothetical protein
MIEYRTAFWNFIFSGIEHCFIEMLDDWSSSNAGIAVHLKNDGF